MSHPPARDHRGRRLGSALCAAALAAGPAAADPPLRPTGSVELGTYWSSEDSFKFGDYTGLDKDGFHLLGNYDLGAQAPWDSGDTWWWRSTGQNLGLSSRALEARGGLRGLFDLSFGYDELPVYLGTGQDTRTVYVGRDNTLTAPENWVPGSTTAALPTLGEDLSSIPFSWDRRDLHAGFGFDLPKGWELVGSWLRDDKEGRDVDSGIFGTSPGNARGTQLARPIDYVTNNGDVALRYTSEKGQLEVGYEVSAFDDRQNAMTFQNLFTTISGQAPGTGFPTGFGRSALPPDNFFQEVRASGGYDLPFDTRIMAHGAFGFMRQNDNLLPYTDNPQLLAPIALPREDADAKIDTTHVGARLTSQPIPKLHLTAEYRFDEDNNNTPRDTFLYVVNDASNQATSLASETARINLPYSESQHMGRFDAAYDLPARTQITAGYERQNIERSWSEVDHDYVNIYRAGIHSQPIHHLELRVDYDHTDRSTSNYFYQAPVVFGFTPQYVATLPPGEVFLNNPLLRKFNMADLEQDAVKARLAATPLERLSLGLDVSWTDQSYPNTELGLRSRVAESYGVDASWSPIEPLVATAWFTHEHFSWREKGRSFSGSGDVLQQVYDPSRNWRQQELDEVDTAGVGVEWTTLGERLVLRTDYAFSMAEDSVNVSKGPALTPAALPFPNANSRQHDLSVTAEYRLRSDMRVRLGYLYESLSTKNWSFDGVEPNTLANVITLNEKNPSYHQHLVGLSFVYDLGGGGSKPQGKP